MVLVILSCCLLIATTTIIHYEILRAMNGGLARLPIPERLKLLAVIMGALMAHFTEMAIYGLAFYGLVAFFAVGAFSGTTAFSLASCLYFSAETYTSLGFGDITPVGPLRLLAGVEALNGLLLIGWSASFAHIAMDRYWNPENKS